MKRTEAVLAAVALVSAVIYALACRPAWSPSGKQVVFPYGERDEITGVALYDVETKSVKSILEEEGEGLAGAQSVWTSDGKAIYVLAPTSDEDGLRVLRVEPSGGAVEEIASIRGLDDATSTIAPVLAGGTHLWLSPLSRQEPQGYFCARVDLRTGKVDEFFASESGMTVLHDLGGRGCWYVRRSESTAEESESIEVGRFDPKAGTLTKVYSPKTGGLNPFIAAEPEGEWIAIIVAAETAVGPAASKVEATETVAAPEGEERPLLRLVNASSGETRDIALPTRLEEVGGMAWAAGGVWLGAAIETEAANGTTDLALVRVDVKDGSTRIMSIGAGSASPAIQPAVSPDGKTLAVAKPMAEAGYSSGLLLLDLTRPDAQFLEVEPPARKTPKRAVEAESGSVVPGGPAVESTGK